MLKLMGKKIKFSLKSWKFLADIHGKPRKISQKLQSATVMFGAFKDESTLKPILITSTM